MKLLISLLLSFLITLLWAVCFIDIEADKFSCFLGFILTALFIFKLEKDNLKYQHKLLLLIFPFAYLIVVDFVLNDIEKIIYNPLNFSFLFLFVGLFFPKLIRNTAFQLFFSILIIGYSYTFFQKFKNNKEQITNEIKSSSRKSLLLDNLVFMNENRELVKIDSFNNKFLLTWNKDCAPCKTAMIDLKNHLQGNFETFLINIPFSNNDFDPNSVKSIIDSNENTYILNDTFNNFTDSLNFKSVPTLIILNHRNEILYLKVGYRQKDKDRIINYLSKLN